MNVLMLGNGFDINYKLPTKYINFLNTVKELCHIYLNSPEKLESFGTVGEIFKNNKLQKNDGFIAESYQAYRHAYDQTSIPFGVVEKLAKLPKVNLWCAYLLHSLNKDIGWIDFEREIAVVIHSFQKILPGLKIEFYDKNFSDTSVDRHIIKTFNFFYHKTQSEGITSTGHPILAVYTVDEEYIVEYPIGSGNKIINCRKVIETMETELKKLAEGLQLYLCYFVENPVRKLTEQSVLPKFDVLKYANQVITFNYTDTYEKVYSNNQVFHIHGNANDTIVLGINPDQTDELERIDTSFLWFKKYYQRIINRCDSEYIRWLTEQQSNTELITPEKISLLIMGHSLDVTDKDIIEELFSISSDITVLYHNEDSHASLVANLVKIFGREKVNKLRTKNKLTFLSLNENVDDFLKRRKETAKTSVERQIEQLHALTL